MDYNKMIESLWTTVQLIGWTIVGFVVSVVYLVVQIPAYIFMIIGGWIANGVKAIKTKVYSLLSVRVLKKKDESN
jgi:hypothetical protein